MATLRAADGRSAASAGSRPQIRLSDHPGKLKGKTSGIRERLQQNAVFRVLMTAVQGYQKDEVSYRAAAMTYFGIFSLFPLLLLFMSLAGFALQSYEQAQQQIMNLITGLLPQGQDQLKQVISGVIAAKGVAAGIGILTLLWSALGWFQVINENINKIWGVDKQLSFIKAKLFALAMVAAIGGVALLSFLATAAVDLLAAFTQVVPGSTVLWQALVSALSVVMIAVGFYLLYRYAPRREVHFHDVWPAALLTAVIWEATRRLLAFYLTQTDMISGYGPIGAAMALLFWIYIASIIILMGAELAYAIAKERQHIPPEHELEVVARPGEQPTPKFAPQVGRGRTSDQEAEEPIRAAGAQGELGNEQGGVSQREAGVWTADDAGRSLHAERPGRSTWKGRVRGAFATALAAVVGAALYARHGRAQRYLGRGRFAMSLGEAARTGNADEVRRTIRSNPDYARLAPYTGRH
jgi:membrane protein